jgi:predicted AlkP superfamily pyrophosphatase or phosphodiesterase
MAMRLIALLAALLLLAARATTPAPAERPPVILISIDGARPDYLDRGVTPTLSALAGEGVRGSLRPSFPVKTFPNHYTLVTGLRPDRHGVVENNMEDPAIPGVTFKMSNKAAVADRQWWDQGEPIWVAAERQGVKTATMFWPGSEAEIRGVRPTYWLPYQEAMPNDVRVDRLLAWLDLPPERRPQFLTLYFHQVDEAGHRAGPDAPEVSAAMSEVDAAVGRLVAGLKARGRSANLIVVSDHGMAPTPPDRRIFLEDLMPPDAGRALVMGTIMTLYPAPGREVEVERALLRPHPHMTCWRKDEIPPRLHYGRNPRVAPILCLPQMSWTITTRPWAATAKPELGSHGYEPRDPEMAALFVAHGPSFRRGARLPAFDNVDVYPLLARLLKVQPAPGDGRGGLADGALGKPLAR